MSKEHAKQFLEKLEEDPDFKNKCQSSSREEMKEIIDQHDLSFTVDEFTEAYMEQVGRELNTEELAQITGGMHPSAPGQVLVFTNE